MDGVEVEEDDEPPRARQMLRHTHVLSDKSMVLTFSSQGHLVRIVEGEGGVMRGDLQRRSPVNNSSERMREKHSMLCAAMLCALLQFVIALLLL